MLIWPLIWPLVWPPTWGANPEMRNNFDHKCEVSERTQNSGEFQLSWQEFRPSLAKPELGTVFIFPPTGGATFLESRYAKKICAQGWPAVVVKSWTGDNNREDDFARHALHFQRAKRAFAMLTAGYPGPVRLLGTSLGGLYTISFMQSARETQSDKIQKAVVIVAGVPFSTVITDSHHSELSAVRERRMKAFQLSSREAYQQKLAESLVQWDRPQTLNPASGRRIPTLAVIGLQDDVVPTSHQREFAKLWQPAKVIEINSGHFWSIVRAYWSFSDQIVTFLTE